VSSKAGECEPTVKNVLERLRVLDEGFVQPWIEEDCRRLTAGKDDDRAILDFVEVSGKV
jgi:hypothetical protein